MDAAVMIRDMPHYRKDAFCAGLKKAGYNIIGFKERPDPHDILVIWNKYGRNEQLAAMYQARGAKVIVCENGYYGKDSFDRQYYAIALTGHCGSGSWYIGGSERLEALGITFKPWRKTGREIVICAQRGIGSTDMRMPKPWPQDIFKKIKQFTGKPVRVRAHPGNKPHKIPLLEDLRNAYAIVVWSSNCATTALIEGIPVFYQAPHIVTQRACESDLSLIDTPNYLERSEAFREMSWAQWTVDEIASGEPFERLLS